MAYQLASIQVRLDDQASPTAGVVTASFDKMAASGDNVTASVTRVGKSATTLANQFDPVTRALNAVTKAQNDLAAAQDSTARGLANGKITVDQQNAVIGTLTDKLQTAQGKYAALKSSTDDTTKSTTGTAAAFRQMEVQASQAFAGIATGQPIMQVLLQQGHQVYDVLQSSGTSFASLGSAAREYFGGLVSAINPAIAATAAVTAGVIALGAAAESSDSRLSALQNSLRASRSDYQAMASTVAETAKTVSQGAFAPSFADALAAAKTIASSPYFTGTATQLETLVKEANDFATVMGTTLPVAAEKFRDSYNDAGAVAQELADKHLAGVSQALALNVERMEAAGNRAGATALLIDQIAKSSADAGQNVGGPLYQSFQKLVGALEGTTKPADDFADKMGGKVLTAATAVVTALTEAVDKLHELEKDAPDAVAKFGSNLADLANKTGVTQYLSNNGGLIGSLFPQFSPSNIASNYNALTGQTAAGSAPMTVTVKAPVLQSYGPPQPTIGQGSAQFNDTLKAASAVVAGSPLGEISKYQDQIKSFTALLQGLGQRTADNATEFDIFTKAISVDQTALAKAEAALGGFQNALDKQKAKLAEQISAQDDLAKAYGQGYDAAAKVIAQQAAAEQAISANLKPGTVAYTKAVADLTDQNLKLAESTGKANIAKQTDDIGYQTQTIQAETDSLGMNNDARAVLLSRVQAEIDLQKARVPLDSAEGQAYVSATVNLTQLTSAYNEHKQALDSLASAFSQSFDTIGNSITQALVSGQGAAVNWQNVLTSAAQQVLQQFLKLAVLNPLLNNLFGQSNPTLVSTIGALGSAGAASAASDASGVSAASASNTSGLLSIGSNLLSTGKSVYNLFTGGISGGSANTGIGFLDSALNYPLYTTSVAPTGFALTGEDAGLGAIANSEALSGALSSSVTIGSAATAIGGIGAGYGLGSLAGGFEQKALNKVGPGPEIGAGVGALAGLAGGVATGAALGSVVPVIGTIIGAIAGGLLGGAIGPRPASPFSSAPVGISDGSLTLGPQISQVDPNAANEYSQQQSDTQTLNQFLASSGLKLTSIGGATQLGDNTPGGPGDPSKFGSVGAAFSQFRFTAADASTEVGHVLDQNISGQSFGDISQLQSVFSEISTFVTQTVPALTASANAGVGVGSLATAIQNLHNTFDPAIAEAQKLGYAEKDLTDARDRAIQAANDAVAKQVAQDQATIQGSYLTAVAAVSGSPQDAETAALYNFDQQATQQRQALATEYQGIFGDAYAATSQYVQTSADLEQSLGEQRLAIQTQYDSQITAAAQAAADQAAQAAAAMQQAWDNLTITDQGLNVSYTNAAAQIDGSPQAAEFAALYSFDVQAQQQKDQFTASLVQSFGDAYTSTQSYTDQMALLEKSLGEQRLAIQTQYDSQITQSAQAAADAASQAAAQAAATQAQAAATQAQAQDQAASAAGNVVTSLTNYLQKLEFGSASPLSPQDQYKLASSQFDAVAGAAEAGDANSIGNLTTYADTLRAASQAVNGSGVGYVNDVDRIVTAISSVAGMGSDALTASFFAATQSANTETLVSELQQLRAEVVALRTDVRQGSMRPARAS